MAACLPERASALAMRRPLLPARPPSRLPRVVHASPEEVEGAIAHLAVVIKSAGRGHRCEDRDERKYGARGAGLAEQVKAAACCVLSAGLPVGLVTFLPPHHRAMMMRSFKRPRSSHPQPFRMQDGPQTTGGTRREQQRPSQQRHPHPHSKPVRGPCQHVPPRPNDQPRSCGRPGSGGRVCGP